MIYCGADPGVTTGLVLIEVTETTAPVLLRSAQPCGDTVDQLKVLEDFIQASDQLIYESFVPRTGKAMTSDWIAPTYRIGALETLAWFYHSKEHRPIGRTPSANKSAVTDENLKNLDLWGPAGHANRHQRDASRVVVGHLKTLRHRQTLIAGWPRVP